VEALELLSAEAAACGAHLHAAHVSDPRSVPVLKRHGATSEVTPHHLLLNSKDVDRLGAYAKVNPPIRDEEDRAGLFQALAQGRLDCVASDHAPHTKAEKDAGFDEAPSGLPGVETLYPLMLAQALEGNISIQRVLDACCASPGRVLGLPVGTFETNQWASFVHVPETPQEIRAEDLHSRCGWSPFEGHMGLFPDALMVRGRWVMRDHELLARPGDGRFVGGPGWPL
ncbi:MAG: dihydroorotase, partial [Candidatus Thermoplasmatota archaeon]|nr:dihydroorotase [Candidatus Thermoplasmatota archaeon]